MRRIVPWAILAFFLISGSLGKYKQNLGGVLLSAQMGLNLFIFFSASGNSSPKKKDTIVDREKREMARFLACV